MRFTLNSIELPVETLFRMIDLLIYFHLQIEEQEFSISYRVVRHCYYSNACSRNFNGFRHPEAENPFIVGQVIGIKVCHQNVLLTDCSHSSSISVKVILARSK